MYKALRTVPSTLQFLCKDLLSLLFAHASPKLHQQVLSALLLKHILSVTTFHHASTTTSGQTIVLSQLNFWALPNSPSVFPFPLLNVHPLQSSQNLDSLPANPTCSGHVFFPSLIASLCFSQVGLACHDCSFTSLNCSFTSQLKWPLPHRPSQSSQSGEASCTSHCPPTFQPSFLFTGITGSEMTMLADLRLPVHHFP